MNNSIKKTNSKNSKLDKVFVSKFNFLWLIIFAPGFILGILVAFQTDVDSIIRLPFELSVLSIIGVSGAILSLLMWSLNPLSDFQLSTDKSRGYISRVVDTTNFVTTWVIAGFLVFELFMILTNVDLKAFFDVWIAINTFNCNLVWFFAGMWTADSCSNFLFKWFYPIICRDR